MRRCPPWLLPLLFMAGCIRPGVLVADTGAHRVMAQDRSSGLTVILTTGAWDGQPTDLGQRITIVHALVSNMGRDPIRLAPGDLELRSERGFRYDLLDAGGAFSVAEQDGATPSYARGQYRTYDYGRSMDFGTIASDSGEIGAAALPWGTLLPGTQMRGFLYFEKVEDTSNAASLVWHMHRPDGSPVLDLAFDFKVARP